MQCISMARDLYQIIILRSFATHVTWDKVDIVYYLITRLSSELQFTRSTHFFKIRVRHGELTSQIQENPMRYNMRVYRQIQCTLAMSNFDMTNIYFTISKNSIIEKTSFSRTKFSVSSISLNTFYKFCFERLLKNIRNNLCK